MRTPEDFEALEYKGMDELPLLVAAKKIQLAFAEASIFARINLLKKRGDVTHGHEHNFDHVTFCWRGAVGIEAITPDGRAFAEVCRAGDLFTIKGGVAHEIVALQDNTIYFCLYSHRDPEGQVIDRSVAYAAAYC